MLSAAIIGTGQIAGGYDENLRDGERGLFTHVSAYQRDGRFHVATVFDTSLDRAKHFTKVWKIPAYATDLKEVLSTFHDVVSVCTPDNTHEDLLLKIIKSRCCKTVFAEKPLSESLPGMRKIANEAEKNEVNVVINFQRRFDTNLLKIAQNIHKNPQKVVTVTAYYMKGLSHIGTTMLDTLCFFFGLPRKVLSYDRRWNEQVNDYSYDFILYYDFFNITVKTADPVIPAYNYHIFEVDILFGDKRLTINDNSRQIVARTLADYPYSGVKVLDDRTQEATNTDYDFTMLKAMDYLFRITTGEEKHIINTPAQTIDNRLLIEAILDSYDGNKPIIFQRSSCEEN